MRTTRARRGDPETSHAAAEQVTALRASQMRVLNMFKLYGDMTDKELLVVLHDAERAGGIRPMSPSGARSRRSELSKPNMDRLDEIKREVAAEPVRPMTDEATERVARERLRVEGFRAPLWDTGRRKLLDGRNHIVWGLAR